MAANRLKVGAAALLVLAVTISLAVSEAAGGAGKARPAAEKPNVVLVLTDDLSWNLIRYMPGVQEMQRRGLTFDRYFVTDSLCCPSRSSIFTGRFPHSTGIFTNMGSDGGFQTFRNKGWERKSYATALQPRGYSTGMMGKYLNGYQPRPNAPARGWSDWRVAGNAYSDFNYDLNENGSVVHYGATASDYLTDVLAAKGVSFIDRAADQQKPFALELSTFTPHQPANPAPRDANDFPGLRAPRGPSFNKPNANPPPWLAGHKRLRPARIAKLDALFRKRVQSIQAVDDMIAAIQAKLRERGLDRSTYLFFTSDNGFHLGEHELAQGKMTAFDTDIRVPLVVTGPGVPAGRETSRIAENIDLHPTFVRLAGGTPSAAVDGRSLVPLLKGQSVRDWRTAALVEHHGPDTNGADPDHPAPGSGNPTSYEALRSANSAYVEYRGGAREYYDHKTDPNERHNTVGRLSKHRLTRLHTQLTKLKQCRGAASCLAAAR